MINSRSSVASIASAIAGGSVPGSAECGRARGGAGSPRQYGHGHAREQRAPADGGAGVGRAPVVTLLVVTDPRFRDHDAGHGHPERPSRLPDRLIHR